MVKKISDRRGKTVKGGKQNCDDFYRIRIILYLLEVGQQNKNQICLNSKYGINRIEGARLKTLLFNMIEDGWIKQVKIDGVNYPVYKITGLGSQIAEDIKHLCYESTHFLLRLDSFANLKEIVSGDV